MPNSFRQAICNLLVFVLLFNTLTPIAVSAAQTLLDEPNKVLVCTNNGFKWIATESDEQNELTHNVELKQHCPMCILHDDNDHDATTHKLNIDLSAIHTVIKRTKKSDRVSNTLYLHEQGSRAPPINS